MGPAGSGRGKARKGNVAHMDAENGSLRSGEPESRSGGKAGQGRLKRCGTRIMELARSPVRIHEAIVRRRFRAAGLSEQQLELANGSVHCWSGGEGPPVVLLHGFGASALWQWYLQVPALARRYTLYIPDLLFFGESTTTRPERSIHFQAETVLQLVSHFGMETVDVVGLSYGGFVALSMAALKPERVRRICLVGSPGYAMGPEDHEQLLERFGVSHVRDILLPRGASGVRRLIRIAWHRPPWIPEFILRDTYAALFCGPVEQQVELLESILDELGNEPEASWPLPHETLILWGEHDQIFPLHLSVRLHGQLGGSAERIILKETAHSPNMEKPAQFNHLLMEFLSR